MAVIGTAGHVDHGKSALVERLTGIDPDRFEEEKRRGLTIDLGFAWLTLPSGREVGIVDVPGHERFIRNMLAGAGGLSTCLFVVAANEGWKPQSAEHLAIVDTLGIAHGVVALTKSDTVDAERIAEVRDDVERRMSMTSLAGAPIVPVSALTGEGIERLTILLDEALERAGEPIDEGRPRLWIDRVFTIKGAGTVVTGTLAGGTLREGDEVTLAPEGIRARVRSIQTHKKRVTQVGPANRVALNLAGLERTLAERGDAVVQPDSWTTTRQIDALVRVLPAWATHGTEHELTARGSHMLYVGSAEVPVRVRLLGTNKLPAGGSGFARLSLRDRLPLQRGDRFVLRDAGRVLTLGGGEVLDPLPKSVDLDLLEQLSSADPDDALRAIVASEHTVEVREALVRSRAQRIPDDIVEVAGTLLSEPRLHELQEGLIEMVSAYHREHPLEDGMPLEVARTKLRFDAATFAAIVARTPQVLEQEKVVRLEQHRVALSPAQEEARKRLLAQLHDAGFSPPLQDALDVDADLLRALVESGELVKVANFYLTRSLASLAQQRVRDFIEANGPVTVAQMRDLLQTTRKYAVPLCEWLDSTGTTIRRGDVRVLGPRARSLPQ